jgi:hypothetical protein
MIPNPISTFAVGVTASFGTVLLAAGTKGHRYALPNATIHMHQPLGGAQGQATDIEIQAKQILRLKALEPLAAPVQPEIVRWWPTDVEWTTAAERPIVSTKVTPAPALAAEPAR